MNQLGGQEWSWIIGFLVVALLLAIYHARSASRSVQDYFVAGRTMPWWVLGTSMVATSFAADTPLAVSGIVITKGISGNWFWWAVLPSGMLGVFFFAHLWQRSGCVTQAEFSVLRYGARRAYVLRVVSVIYQGLLQNCIILGWVNLAMVKIIETCTPLPKEWAIAVCFFLTVVYTLLGGITGVMWTDFVQFFLALGSSFLAAWYCVRSVGGLDQLVQAIQAKAAIAEATAGAADPVPQFLAYFPAWGTTAAWAFAIYTTIFWVACTPTDCTGYAVQRLLSARSERHAVWGYLWFNVAHYVLRPWPWILMGLVALAAFDYGPGVQAANSDPEKAYIEVLLQRAPQWLIGPVLASLLAAYMSTIDTHLNWGASYVINDLYMPYVNPGQSQKHYVMASRIATIGVALCGVSVTLAMDRITGGWGLFYSLLAGMGVIRIGRWLWWRVNAWTEIGCMAATALSTGVMALVFPDVTYPFNLLVIVPVSLLGAVVGTLAVTAEPDELLRAFVQRVRPPGPGWRRYRNISGSSEDAAALLRPTVCWLLSTAAVLCAMFGVGDLLLHSAARGVLLCGLAAGLAVVTGLIYKADSSIGTT